jgi:hypothetical protein
MPFADVIVATLGRSPFGDAIVTQIGALLGRRRIFEGHARGPPRSQSAWPRHQTIRAAGEALLRGFRYVADRPPEGRPPEVIAATPTA